MLKHGLFSLPTLTLGEKFFLRGLCALPGDGAVVVEGTDLNAPSSERMDMLMTLERKGRIHVTNSGVHDDGTAFAVVVIRREFLRRKDDTTSQ